MTSQPLSECAHTMLCTPHRGVHFSQISLQSHVTTHLSQSEGSILSNLSDLVRNCEISPKIFPPFKEQSCYNSSAKKYLLVLHDLSFSATGGGEGSPAVGGGKYYFDLTSMVSKLQLSSLPVRCSLYSPQPHGILGR